jgi:hypothetical protein
LGNDGDVVLGKEGANWRTGKHFFFIFLILEDT